MPWALHTPHPLAPLVGSALARKIADLAQNQSNHTMQLAGSFSGTWGPLQVVFPSRFEGRWIRSNRWSPSRGRPSDTDGRPYARHLGNRNSWPLRIGAGERQRHARAGSMARLRGVRAQRCFWGTMVSPRSNIATSVAIFFARPAGVFMLFVRNASANRFGRPRIWNVS